ncbi:MAG: hypothetical protein FWC64_06440 [Treponema sp.]|nr:hypothetical protein [Treponema sp.]
MKKLPLICLPLLVFLFAGCATAGFPHDLFVAPDPDNPFQGTWVSMRESTDMIVIEGDTATFYSFFGEGYNFLLNARWRRTAVHPVEERDGLRFVHTWPASIFNDRLTVGDTVYERYPQ